MQTGSTWHWTRFGTSSRRRRVLRADFQAAEPAEVRALMERMQADGVTIAVWNDEAAYVAFKCLDPDGHRIEVYWESLRSR